MSRWENAVFVAWPSSVDEVAEFNADGEEDRADLRDVVISFARLNPDATTTSAHELIRKILYALDTGEAELRLPGCLVVRGAP
jgi:hypothetical protein